MRSLQKLKHSRPVPLRERGDLRLAESERVGARERRIWLHRARRVLPAVLIVAAAWGAYSIFAGMRRVADGLALVHRVVLEAPERVRVAEVFLQPGQACLRGDPLVRLEGVTGRLERGRLEALVDSRQRRLELSDAGGQAEEFGRALRADLAAEAWRQAGQATVDRELAEARLVTLRHERAELELTLEEESMRRHGLAAAHADREEQATALLRVAEAELELAGFDTSATKTLHDGGVVADRDVLSRGAAFDASTSTVESLTAAARVQRHEVDTATALVDSIENRGATSLAVADARIAAAEEEVRAATTRTELWHEMEAHHRALDPPGATDVVRVRMLRRAVLEAEVADAAAQLAAHDHRRGEVILRAETDGLVDRVLVGPGDVVEEGTALLMFHNPAELSVVAYVPPGLASELAPGQSCRLVAEGEATPVEATITSVASAWMECPPSLPHENGVVDLRVPVVVECAEIDRVLHLAPNMRRKVVFSGRRR